MNEIKVTVPFNELFEIVQTCGACPEQYDVRVRRNNELVGYLRLRHGLFYAACPDVMGDRVYEACDLESDGVFTDEERNVHMPAALTAVYIWYVSRGNL